MYLLSLKFSPQLVILIFFTPFKNLVRILWMLQPLSWYNFIWNPVADSLLYGFANDFSFMTDLLITFYWQEILLKVDRSLSNKLLNNLGT